jgi:hypothetical protein
VAGRIGDDEFALGRGEVAVSHVDRDALLAFGDQAVGQQGEVDRDAVVHHGIDVAADAAAARRGPHEVVVLIFEDRLGVEQQATDQRALAVVDAAGRGEAQEVHVFIVLLFCEKHLALPVLFDSTVRKPGVPFRTIKNSLPSFAVPSRRRTSDRPCAWHRVR